jgi:hypothetical protein
MVLVPMISFAADPVKGRIHVHALGFREPRMLEARALSPGPLRIGLPLHIDDVL